MQIVSMYHGVFNVPMCLAMSLTDKKSGLFLFNFVGQIFPARSSFSRTTRTSLFNICSSCGGLYLEVLLGKPTHNVYQM